MGILGLRLVAAGMPLKKTAPATDYEEIDRWDGGVGWIAYPDEELQRASHALAVDGDVWVLDPVDAPGLDDLLSEFGEVVGVVVCVDRHERDAAAVANRHDAPVYVPDWMTGVASGLDAPTERFGRELADSGYRALTVRDQAIPPWQEVALYNEARGTLVVPESVGTTPIFRAADERLGVHPLLRLTPPVRTLGELTPQRVFVGHGEGVTDDATSALREALDGSVAQAPSAYARALRVLFS